jgi:hypothetical protein
MKNFKTFSGLLNYVKKDLVENNSFDLVEEHTCIELVESATAKIIIHYALENINLTHKECDILWNTHYGIYAYCNSKDDIKIQLLIDALDYNLVGEKMTVAQMKKKALKESQ